MQKIFSSLQVAIKSSSKSSLKEMDTVEVDEWACRATLDIVGQGGFGHDFGAINDIDDTHNALTRIYRGIFAPCRMGQILEVLGFLLP